MSTLSFEQELAYNVTHQSFSLFSRSVQSYIRNRSPIEIEQLSDVRGFIEKYAFPRQQRVDLKDLRIQELFDRALMNVIEKDCSRYLTVLEEKEQDRKLSERLAAGRAQEEARLWQQKGNLGRLEALVVQTYRKCTQKAPECAVFEVEDEKDDVVILETVQMKEQKAIALLQEWKKKPLDLIPFTSVAQEIGYIRNTLLPKAKEIVLETPEQERMRKEAPTLTFRRIS